LAVVLSSFGGNFGLWFSLDDIDGGESDCLKDGGDFSCTGLEEGAAAIEIE